MVRPTIEKVSGIVARIAPRFRTGEGVFWGFVILHMVYAAALLPVMLEGQVLGDLPLYRVWGTLTLHAGQVPGVTMPWVYPIGALLPIVGSELGGSGYFLLIWFLIITTLDALATWMLARRGTRAAINAAWWYMIAGLLLSPVALLRLEGISAPLVVIALVLLASRPRVAAALLAVATWIKVWPAAVLLAVVTVSKSRWTAITVSIATSAAFVTLAFVLGGTSNVFSFATAQTDRGLQLEAPVATLWLWAAKIGHSGIYVFQNTKLETREVAGPGTELAASAMNPLMAISVVAIIVLLLVALRRKRAATDLVLLGSLGLATALVVFNKVGSPQYQLWIVPIVAVGLVTGQAFWRGVGALVLVISLLTTLIFPVLYLQVIELRLLPLTLLSLRNALVVVLLGVTIAKLAGITIRVPSFGLRLALQNQAEPLKRVDARP